MKKYEYVPLQVGQFFGTESIAHREIINKYAALGFRYVGYIPTREDTRGRLITVDLIFEVDY